MSPKSRRWESENPPCCGSARTRSGIGPPHGVQPCLAGYHRVEGVAIEVGIEVERARGGVVAAVVVVVVRVYGPWAWVKRQSRHAAGRFCFCCHSPRRIMAGRGCGRAWRGRVQAVGSGVVAAGVRVDVVGFVIFGRSEDAKIQKFGPGTDRCWKLGAPIRQGCLPEVQVGGSTCSSHVAGPLLCLHHCCRTRTLHCTALLDTGNHHNTHTYTRMLEFVLQWVWAARIWATSKMDARQ